MKRGGIDRNESGEVEGIGDIGVEDKVIENEELSWQVEIMWQAMPGPKERSRSLQDTWSS